MKRDVPDEYGEVIALAAQDGNPTRALARVTQYMKKTELAKAKEFDLLNREDYIQRLLEKRKSEDSP